MKAKRLIVSTLFGLIFGFVCFGFASSGPGDLPLELALNIIISRTLIGFAIGISNLKCRHWAMHGILMGILFSIPAGLGAMMSPDPGEFTPCMLMVSTIVMGAIYGLLIELFTSLVFKLKQA